MPQSELAGQVLALVNELADSSGADADTPFMDAGIDSMASAVFVDRLATMTGLEFDETLIFEHATPRAVASHIAALAVGTGTSSIDPANEARQTLSTARLVQPSLTHDQLLFIIIAALTQETTLATHGGSVHGESVMSPTQELSASAFTSTVVIDEDTSLSAAGLTSTRAAAFVRRIESLAHLQLSPALVVEELTPRTMTMHLLEPVSGSGRLGALAPSHTDAELFTKDVTGMHGAVGWWPGGTSAERGCLLWAAGNAIGSVPARRWCEAATIEAADVKLTPMQLRCARHGGFIMGAQRFDATFFGMGRSEATSADPQQRLLLEVDYMALHACARRRAALVGSVTASVLGMERPDWVTLRAEERRAAGATASSSPYDATSSASSIAAGRTSYVLGLHGPCTAVDSACSSALVALHVAATEAARTDSAGALSSSVGLKLHAGYTIEFAAAGMLSNDGRCKSFDARANGYARSEGVGSLVLCATSAFGCGHGASGSVLCGSAVRQDGRSASLTAPNGNSQRDLLIAALTSAASGAMARVEAHGTGTPLGDPTEAKALAAVVSSARSTSTQEANLAAVGGAKASVGHTEAPAGQVGLMRAIELHRSCVMAPNAQLRTLNPVMQQNAGTALAMPMHLLAWRAHCTLGISSFGFGGTIAHSVTAQADDARDAQKQQQALRTRAPLRFARTTFTWRGTVRTASSIETPHLHLVSSCQSNSGAFACPRLPSPAFARLRLLSRLTSRLRTLVWQTTWVRSDEQSTATGGERSLAVLVIAALAAPVARLTTIDTTVGAGWSPCWSTPAQAAILLLPAAVSIGPCALEMAALLSAVQRSAADRAISRLTLICSTSHPDADRTSAPATSCSPLSVTGLMRVSGIECATLRLTSIFLPPPENILIAVSACAAVTMGSGGAETELAWRRWRHPCRLEAAHRDGCAARQQTVSKRAGKRGCTDHWWDGRPRAASCIPPPLQRASTCYLARFAQRSSSEGWAGAHTEFEQAVPQRTVMCLRVCV